MAYFKISLLTPRADKQAIYYIEDLITEFNINNKEQDQTGLQESNYKDLYDKNIDLLLGSDQEDASIETRTQPYQILKQEENQNSAFSNTNYGDYSAKPAYVTAYTYNEKVSFGLNGQKTLSFDLNRYVLKENEWVENPFAHLLTEGTQLLLTDQYSNEYFFTVTSTKFNIKENNIVYNITCQDSFSYQVSRQNDGYTIENDPNEADFIGAKTIDWWVLRKIVPECYLTNYKYLSCNSGLYEDYSGAYHIFKYNEMLSNVKRIIKDAHTPPVYDLDGSILQENDIDYFEQVSFSCSGVNANAALIQLAEQINLQLVTFEHAQIKEGQRTHYFDRFFWFEPIKNEKRIGLVYSPTHNIKSFDLTHKGDSLTTVLNVSGPTYDDEIITLLPDVPAFFLTYFNSSDWEDSSYVPGLFTQLCKNRMYLNTTDTSYTDTTKNSSAYFSVITDNIELLVRHPITYEEEWVSTDYPFSEGDIILKIRFPIYNHKDKNNERLFSFPPYYSHFNYRYKEELQDLTYKIYKSNIIINKRDQSDQLISELVSVDSHDWTLMYSPVYWAIYKDNNVFITNKTLRQISKRINEEDIVELKSDGYYYINNKVTNLSVEDIPANTTGLLARLVNQENIELYEDVSTLSSSVMDVKCYIVIDYDNITITEAPTLTISNLDLYLNFYRDFTKEELEFAKIADQCPWLENKLIDFTYFKDTNTISQKEYDSLMNIILNQLRRVNGSLMFYARGYYKSLQERTKMLAELINNLDSIGAACQAAVIDPMAKQGRTSEDNRQYFENAYTLLMNSPWKRKSLLRYDEVISDYFSKYFNAQQRFLKNIYNFREFFNAPYVSTIPDIYEYELTINNGNNDIFYTFDNTVWSSIDNFTDYAGYGNPDQTDLENYGQPYFTIYHYIGDNSKYIPEEIASADKIGKSLYKLPTLDDNRYFCLKDSVYKEIEYGQIVIKVPATRIHNDDDTYSYCINGSMNMSKNGSKKNHTGFDVVALEDFNNTLTDWDGLLYLKIECYRSGHLVSIGFKTIVKANTFVLENSETGSGYFVCYQIRQGADWEHQLPLSYNYVNAKPDYFFNYATYLEEGSTYKATIYRAQGYSAEAKFSSNSRYKISSCNTYSSVELEVVRASVNTMIENWLLNQADFQQVPYSNIVRRITPLYTNFPGTQYKNHEMIDWKALKDIAKICYSSVITVERDDEDVNDDQESMYKDAGKETIKADIRRKYYHHLPITDAYQKLPQFHYDEITDEAGNVSYFFKRVNKHGQSLTDYINYKLGKTTTYVINPYQKDQEIITRIPYVTPSNESTFYRRVVITPKANFWWLATLLIPPVPGSLAIRTTAALTCAYLTSYYKWDLEGNGCRDVYNHKTSKWSGYCGWLDNHYESGDFKEVIYPFYAVASDTVQKKDEYLKAINEAVNVQLWKNTTPDLNINSKTINLNQWKDEFLRIPIETAKIKNNTVILEYSKDLLKLFSSDDIDPFTSVEQSQALTAYRLTNYGYTYRDIPNSAQFINTVYEPLSADDLVYKNDKYAAIIIQQTDDDMFIQTNGWEERLNAFLEEHWNGLSSVLYYPLINQTIPFSVETYQWAKDNYSITLQELLDQSGRTVTVYENTPYIIGFDDVYMLFFRIRDFETESMSVIYNDAFPNYSTAYNWYDVRTHDKFNFKQQVGLPFGFYRMPNVSSDLILTSKEDQLDENGNIIRHKDIFDINNGIYYSIEGTRIYTIKQLSNQYYYIKNSHKMFEYAQESQNRYPVTIIRNEKVWDNDHKYLIRINKEVLNSCYELDFSEDATIVEDSNTHTQIKNKDFIVGDNVINITTKRSLEPKISLKGLTNGSFWYFYHNKTDRPLLFEQAAAIEVQLTEYWTNAYYASKGCEYFLPESWTPTSNQENNFFNQNIYFVQNNTAILSNYFLPEVKIYKSKENNATSTQYRLFFRSADTTIDDIKSADITDNARIFNATSIINNNLAFYYAFRRLMPEDEKEPGYWIAEEIGHTTYYYVDNINSGMLWEDFVGIALKHPNAYQEMSGNYVMGYRLLRRYYYNNNFEQYLLLQKEHDQIWKTLYENYGYLILENTYKSETATNSNDLLTTALLYFKDRKTPERAYNISIIDTASLDNYQGAEIRIGDGIKINAREYYDEYDLVYQSLSKYLFISNISYTLRNTADISLTVNDVKYEEGIIKRLAKLIK